MKNTGISSLPRDMKNSALKIYGILFKAVEMCVVALSFLPKLLPSVNHNRAAYAELVFTTTRVFAATQGTSEAKCASRFKGKHLRPSGQRKYK